MYTFVVLFHVLACMALILIVLLQTGKGAEMGAAFGGASQTLFGGSGGTTFLGRLTTGAAIAFMITCLGLTYLSTGPSTKSVMEDVPLTTTEVPLLPDAKPVQPAAEPEMPPTTAAPAAQGQEAAQAQPSAQEEAKPAAPAKAQEKQPAKPPTGGKKQ